MIEPLEGRLLLAAHIVGSAAVYPTIQAAVYAATPGAVITVDPGVYPELVWIDKTLTIQGAQAGVDARSAVRLAANSESVVTGEAVGSFTSSAFYIAANDVTIDGLTVQGQTSAGQFGAGIVIAPNIAGTHIINNVIQNNIAGINLSNNSPTDPAVIQYNFFQNNNNDGANSGRGIYTNASVSGGNLTNVTIDSNFFFNNYGGAGTTRLESAIGLESQTPNAQSNISITNNVMEGNGKAVLAFNVTNLVISGNTVTTSRDQFSAALRFEGNDSNVTIQNNNVYFNPGPAIRSDEKDAPAPSTQFTVTNNNFYGNSFAYANPGDSLIVAAGTYTGTMDARNNWWGDASGPSDNGTGTGDGISTGGNDVVYSPWSTVPVVSRDTPFNGLPNVTGVPIQAENFDQGGSGFAYYANGRTRNPAGLWNGRNSGVGVTTASDLGGGYMVGFTAPGQWYDYAVNVAQSGTYRLDVRVATPQTIGGKFHLEVDGVNVTGTMITPNTGDWQVYQTISSGGFSLTAGQHILRLVMDANGNNGAVGDFNWIQLTPTPFPAIPTGLHVTIASGTELDLSWADSDNSVTNFNILRQTGGTGDFISIATVSGSTLSYNDTGLSPNTTYSYQVVAVNAIGSSSAAGPVKATTPLPPGAPTNLAASNITTGGVTLSWAAPANVNGYQITRQSGASAPQIVATLPGSATNFTDSGLSPGVQYQYVVSAFNLGGTGSGSAIGVQTVALPPTGITASAVQNQITLNWTASIGAISYNIYRGTASGAETTTPIATGISGTSFVDPGLNSGTSYYYLITAVDSTAESAKSGEVSAHVAQTIAPAPTGLTAGGNQNQITLSWIASTNVTSYNIYRGTAPGAESATPIVSGVIATSFMDSGLAPGASYFYQITAVNDAGESPRSAEASATVPFPVPASPKGVAAAVSGSQITLTWAASNFASSYRIYRGTSSGGEATAPLAIGITGTTFVDPGLTAGTTYYYQVTAVNASGESMPGTEVSGTPQNEGGTINAPAAPTNLQSSNVTTRSVTLSWTAPAGAGGFQIMRQLGSTDPTSVATLDASASSFIDSGLLPDSTYQYTVWAFNSAGAGPGTSISVQTSLAPPAIPTGVAAIADDHNITISWSAAAGATSYNIFRATTAGGESTTPLATGISATSFLDTSVTAGTTYYYLVTAVNGAGASTASNEVSAKVVILQQPPPLPDPSVIQPSVVGKLPASGIAGGKLNAAFTVTLTNTAHTSYSGSVNGKFYLAPGDTIDANAILLPTGLIKKLKLKAGQKLVAHLKLASLPASISQGTYHLLFQITDAGRATNTAVVGTIGIAPAHIDLTGAFTRVPSSAAIGKKQSITFTITNDGTLATSGLLPIILNASATPMIDESTIQLISFSKAIKLGPGKSVRGTISFVPGSAMPAHSYLILQLDPAKTFHDISIANNTFSSPHSIAIG